MEDVDSRPRVIIAEDDPLARRVLRDCLQHAGIVVVADAVDGREAVELAVHYRPDLVLMDLMMPGMDPVEASRLIREQAPSVKVLVISATGDEDLGLLALHAGAVGFLSKAVDPDALVRAVRGAVSGEAAISRRLVMRLLDDLHEGPRGGPGLRPVRSELTPREWEVLDLLAEGASTQEIADALVLTQDTIYTHVKRILRKLDVRSREEAIARANVLRRAA